MKIRGRTLVSSKYTLQDLVLHPQRWVLALRPRQLRAFLGRQFLAVTFVDVGLPQPAAVGNVEPSAIGFASSRASSTARAPNHGGTQ
jgi:hypothetical protein